METGYGYGQKGIQDRTRIYLQPIAAPSILGLYAFATATFLVSINMAGWYGGGSIFPQAYVLPFGAIFGGLVQLLAGMWAFKARDGVATAMHGLWGSFWIGYGLLFALVIGGAIPITPATFVPIGYWFVPLALITYAGAVASLRENMGMFAVLFLLATGSAIAAVGFFTGLGTVLAAAGWVLLFSSIVAYYTATAMMLEPLMGAVLPLGKKKSASIEPGAGEPAVIKGQ